MDVEVMPLLTQAANAKFSFIAGAFLLIYDTVMNFSYEVNFVWLKRWSFGKVLYIITRYSAFVDGLRDHDVVDDIRRYSRELGSRHPHVRHVGSKHPCRHIFIYY